MSAIVRTCLAIVFVLLAASPIAAQRQPPEQQGEFIPIDQLPPAEQMPAAPLLIGAYSFVVVVLFAYLLTVSRRLVVVQREVGRLEADMKRSGRG
jgi:CcmD family protein